MASKVLGTFLASTPKCLVARVKPGERVVEANEGFRKLLTLADSAGGEAEADWTAALTSASRKRWGAWIEGQDLEEEPGVLDLDFVTSEGDLPYRCLVHRDVEGFVWLLGLPQDGPVPQPQVGDGDRDAAEMAIELARLRKQLRRSGRWMQKKVEEAHTDPLTGLANRRQGDRWLALAVANAQASGLPLSLVIMDLDNFKTINDTYGHPVGDQVLKTVAQTMAAQIRPLDRIYRYGGEEFAILLPETDLLGGLALADRLRLVLSEQVLPPIGQGLSASFGVSYLGSGESSESLLSRADDALIRAKRFGRNRVEREA